MKGGKSCEGSGAQTQGDQRIGGLSSRFLEGMQQGLARRCPLTFARVVWAGEEGWSIGISPGLVNTSSARTGRQRQGMGPCPFPCQHEDGRSAGRHGKMATATSVDRQADARFGPRVCLFCTGGGAFTSLPPGPHHFPTPSVISFLPIFPLFLPHGLCLSRVTQMHWG